MADFPYTIVTGKISKLLGKIKEVGIPAKADNKWLQNIGFQGENDDSLLRVLKALSFIDESDKPTTTWSDYRGGNFKQVLARAIKRGYSELYSTYPNAHLESKENIDSFFMSSSKSLSKGTVSKVSTTFFNLCSLADFTGSQQGPGDFSPSSIADLSGPQQGPGESRDDTVIPETPTTKVVKSFGPGITVNINIQLTLPETTDESIYEKLFSAMKKHLLSGS
jgi:hypothetical protein